MRHVCFVFISTLLLVGCAINKPMTPTQFQFRCIMKPAPGDTGDDSGSCGGQMGICSEFQSNIMSVKDGAACKRICRETKNKLYQRFVTDTCRVTVRQAYDLCTLYCMSNYD